MREYLFHGKRLDNGEWVEGGYWSNNIDVDIIDNDGNSFAVDPKTVGQFTGLTDKNGRKIFEGDIVKHCSPSPYHAENQTFMVFWEKRLFNDHLTECGWVFKKIHKGMATCYNPEKVFEVIGNRWDNPELLEGTENVS